MVLCWMEQNVHAQKDITWKAINALYAQYLFLGASNAMMKIPAHRATLMINLFPNRMMNISVAV